MSENTPPSPTGVPVLGNAIENIRTPMEFRRRCVDQYDGIIEVNMANVTMYMITSPGNIEQILVKNDHHYIKPSEMREQLSSVFGDGLLLSENEFWRKQRGTINPAFHPKKVESYTDTMVSFTKRLIDEWNDEETVDMRQEMDRLALQIVMKSLFNVDFRGSEDEILTPIKQINKRYKPSSFSSYLPEWVPTRVNRAYNHGKDDLASQVDQIIKDRREGIDQENDLLARLLSATDKESHQMTSETLQNEITTIALGASGPVGLALTFTWYLLAQSEEVSHKLYSELSDVLGGDPVTLDDVPNLNYTKKVIKESLRLYPPVWGILREPETDVTIDGYDIPEGTPLSITPWAVHRNRDYFEQPDSFTPERWTPEFEESLPDYAYVPFGAGPRTCVGKHFALLEMQLAVPTIFQQYSMGYTSEEPVELSVAHILEPSDTVEIALRKR